jgi:hypothetical protein
MADSGVPQVPETQGFTTATAISTLGTVTETDNIVTLISGNHQGLPPGIMPLYYEWESVYTSSYTEHTIADQGLVTYTKGISYDTAGAAAQNVFNMKTNKIVEFVGLDTGRMTSAESTLLDGVGTAMEDNEILLCPFASITGAENPAFCNIVEEGSSVDLTIGSLTTGSAQRYIMLKSVTEEEGEGQSAQIWDLPVSDPGVEVNYDIKLTGFGDIPASGSAQAFMNVHIQEARTVVDMGTPLKAEDLVYSESSTASGEITLFRKVMGYTSKITAPGPVEVI